MKSKEGKEMRKTEFHEERDRSLLEYWKIAIKRVSDDGYGYEADWCIDIANNREKITPIRFFEEYVWCVLNAGMKEQIARKIFDRFFENLDFDTIGHPGKREAIRTAASQYDEWFDTIKKSRDPIQYLESLPWIGKITKYHMARNIGYDVVKPDRHLVKLAEVWGFQNPTEMCRVISTATNICIGAVDVVLWRYCNLTGNYRLDCHYEEPQLANGNKNPAISHRQSLLITGGWKRND